MVGRRGVAQRRQSDNLVVAIGAGGSGCIPVQALGAAGGVVVGARRTYVGIAKIRGAVVHVAPARDKACRGGRTCRLAFEVFAEGDDDGGTGRGEGVKFGRGAVVVVAECRYIYVVGGVAGQAGEGCVGVAYIERGAVAAGEAVGAVLYVPLRCGAEFGPANVCSTGVGAVNGDVGHVGAVGHGLNGDVVNIGIPGRGGSVGLDGDVAAVTGVGNEGNLEFGPVGAFHIDGVHSHKGGHVVGVGHHAYLEYRVVAGRGGLGPEFHHQVVHGVARGVDGGCHNNLVVAVGAGGGAAIPVKAGAARVGIAAGVRHVGVAKIRGAVVQAGPAGGKHRAAAGAGGLAFKAFGPRQRVDVAAGGAEAGRGPGAVAAAAVGAQPQGVAGVRAQVGKGQRRVAHRERHAVGRGLAVAQYVFKRGGNVGPVQRNAVRADVGYHGRRHGALCRVNGNVVNISVVVAGGGLGELKGNVAVVAHVVGKRHNVLLVGGHLRGDGVHRHKRRRVGGAGHHAYHHGGYVRGRVGAVPKTHLYVRPGVVVHVKGGQNGYLVGIGAGGDVGVEAHRVAAAVRVGGRVVHYRVARVRGAGAFVVVLPAQGQVVHCGRGRRRTGHSVKVLGVGQRVHGHAGGDKGGRVQSGHAVAVGGDVHVVGSLGVQVVYHGNGVKYGYRGAGAAGKSGSVILYVPRGGAAVLAPGYHGRVGGEAQHCYVFHAGAVGRELKGEVVYIEVLGRAGAAGHKQRYVGAVALEVDKVYHKLLVRRVGQARVALHGLEGARVVGVAHHAHAQIGGVRGGVAAGIEAQRQVRNVKHRRVHGRKGHHQVVGIAGRGGRRAGHIGVDGLGAAVRVRGVDVGVVVGIGAAAVAGKSPAVGHAADACGAVLKAVVVGQGADGCAGSHKADAVVARYAVAGGGYVHVIQGHGGQSRQLGRRGGHRHSGAVAAGKARGAVLHYPRRGVALLGPRHGGRGGLNVAHAHAVNAQAVGALLQGNVVKVGVAGAGGGLAEGYVAARAGVGVQVHHKLLPRAGGAGSAGGAYLRKGADVVGVGHHAHVHLSVVRGGAGRVEVEGHLQVLHAVLHRGHHQVAVVGGRGVEIQGVGAAVRVGARGVGVGSGVVGALAPAGVDGRCRAGGRGILKAVAVGHVVARKLQARGAERHRAGNARVAGAANGVYVCRVLGVGHKAGELHGGVRNNGLRAVVCRVVIAVQHGTPRRGAAGLGPCKGHRARTNVRRVEVRGSGAGGGVGLQNIVAPHRRPVPRGEYVRGSVGEEVRKVVGINRKARRGIKAHAHLAGNGGTGRRRGAEHAFYLAVVVEVHLPLVEVRAGGGGVGAGAEFYNAYRVAVNLGVDVAHVVVGIAVAVATKHVNLGAVLRGIGSAERRGIVRRTSLRRAQAEVAVGIHRELGVVGPPKGEREAQIRHSRLSGVASTRGDERRHRRRHRDPSTAVDACRVQVVVV